MYSVETNEWFVSQDTKNGLNGYIRYMETTIVNTEVAKVTKRKYTKRGTTVLGKRVVLLDGKPVGRGRPAKNGKGKRTVVFVPIGEQYDAVKHGTGMEYRSSRHAVLRRLKVKNKVIDLTPAVVETDPMVF